MDFYERSPQLISLVLVAGCSLLLIRYLIRFYTPGNAAQRAQRLGRAVAWDFEPGGLGGSTFAGLALASLLGLYLELLMIRWVSSEIPVYAYLKNFVLIACFLGFGLGCHLCRRRANLLALLAPLLGVTVIVAAPWPALAMLTKNLQVFVGGLAEVETWGLATLPKTWQAWEGVLTLLAISLPLFALISFVFIPIGQMVGCYLERGGKGIRGYTVNILASLAGVLLFTLLSFFSQPPWVWLAGAGLLLAGLLRRSVRLWSTAAVCLALVAAIAALAVDWGFHVYWSPYQKLGLKAATYNGEVSAYELVTNGTRYQRIFNLSPDFVSHHPELFRATPMEWNPYNLPYRFYPNPPSVLVLGAGTGNDVAAALRNGAGEVTAVEIDPLILRLGRQLHFEHPYSSPRVQAVNDDARSYLQTSSQKFDLIMFSLLDSHTTNTYYSNIRIDNYVYTLEAIEAARRLLKPDGLLVVKYWVETPWIGGRLNELLETVFQRPPLQLQTPPAMVGTSGRFFICGSQERITAAMNSPELAAFVAQHSHIPLASAHLTTDDWPYFYQREPGLPTIVVLMSAVLVPLCWLLLRSTGTAGRSLEWHFFFLGAGFLLLETQIISKMALVFGTTWVVNAVVISALLLLIVGANAVVEWRPDFPIAAAYAGIFVTLLAAYLTPVRALLFPSVAMKIVASTVVFCLPVFFAGIVFVRSYAQAGFRGEALGSNLFGALAGGLLEATSFWFGLRFLLLLAGALYLASWLTLAARREVVRVGAAQAPTPTA